jgi:hypothetical protein
MITPRFLLLAILIASAPAGAGVYKWTDAQGRVHYSDDPPADAKAQQIKVKINSIQGPAVVSTLRSTPAAKAKDKVRIYTAVWCGYCKRAKAHLAAKGVAYDEMDVEIVGDVGFDLVQQLAELGGAVAGEALADHLPGGDVEGGEQRGRAVAFIIVRHRSCAPGLHWQSRLGAVERLYLAHMGSYGSSQSDQNYIVNFLSLLRIQGLSPFA